MKVYLMSAGSHDATHEGALRIIKGIVEGRNGVTITHPFPFETQLKRPVYDKTEAAKLEELKMKESDVIVVEGSIENTGMGVRMGVMIGEWIKEEKIPPILYLYDPGLGARGASAHVEGWEEIVTVMRYDHTREGLVRLRDGLNSYFDMIQKGPEAGVSRERGR